MLTPASTSPLIAALCERTAMDLGLSGRKVLVTGASQGIGEGLGRAFAVECCDTCLMARSTERVAPITEQLHERNQVEVPTLAVDIA